MTLIHMYVALAILFSMPFTLWQFGKFVSPALKGRERRMVLKTIVPATFLFLSGCLFAFFFIIPFIIRFLFDVITGLDAQALITADAFMKFVILFSLGFGFVFQLPIVMNGLSRLGLVDSKFWLRHWRLAFVVMILFGGLITPDGSGITQMMIAVPMLFLYFMGYLSVVWWERRQRKK